MEPIKISASAYSALLALTRWYEALPECLNPSDDFVEQVWEAQLDFLPETVMDNGDEVTAVQLADEKWLQDMRDHPDVATDAVSHLRPGMLVAVVDSEKDGELYVEIQGE